MPDPIPFRGSPKSPSEVFRTWLNIGSGEILPFVQDDGFWFWESFWIERIDRCRCV